MPEILDEFPHRRHGGGRSGSRWDQYLDGRIYRLEPDDLGPAKPISARIRLFERAAKRGWKIRTRIDGDAIIVQAYDPKESA